MAIMVVMVTVMVLVMTEVVSGGGCDCRYSDSQYYPHKNTS